MPRRLAVVVLLVPFALACGLWGGLFERGPRAKESSFEAQSSRKVDVASAPRGLFLIRDATVLTLDPDLGAGPLGILEDADVLFDDTIRDVGYGLSAGAARVIEGRGKVVLPGFVDTHNHLWQSLIRGCGANRTVDPWMKKCVVPGARLSDDEVYAGVRLSTVDVISTGVTTVLDWSHAFTGRFAEGNVRALRDSNLRFVFGFLFYGRPLEERDLLDLKKVYIDPNPLAGLHIAAHPHALAKLGFDKAVKAARELEVPLNVHLLENSVHVEDEPIRVLEKADAFDNGVFANHCVHVSKGQIERLAAENVSVSHNPLSNLRLASGVMPLGEFAEQKVRVGLGLDGAANDTSDFFAIMRAAVGLQRGVKENPRAYPSVEQVIRMATLGGAEALGMDHLIGSLTPGKRGDLILLNPSRVNFAPVVDDLVPQIVFNGQPGNVEAVFVDGWPLKLDGELVLEDTTEDEIIARAQEATRRFVPVFAAPPAKSPDFVDLEAPELEPPEFDRDLFLATFGLTP